jgi:DNA repair protein RadC
MKQLSFLPGEMTPQDRRLIQRALRALDRHLHEPGVAFTSTHAVREWLRLHMAALEREEFRVLYLDNQNQLIAHETLFTGTINRTEVHPREVVKRALHFNAAAVILAHNHPSGETTPSQADKTLTQRLVQVLQLVDIRVPTTDCRRQANLFVRRTRSAVRYVKIISKRRAMTIYRQHPESRIFRYCSGKYQWHGSVCHYTGRDVPDITESSRYTPNAANGPIPA